jgi:hypothetical protein
MGNVVSTPDCCVLKQIPQEKFEQLLAERFTVIRTSGKHQNGWYIPSVTHPCHEGHWSKYHAHVWDNTTNGKGEKDWRFHMMRDADDEGEHCCGWRRERTFWPTRLTTEEEKDTWWAEFDALISTLKKIREMSDAEWMPLYEAQQKREAEAYKEWEYGSDAARRERVAKVEAQRQAAAALDPEMASRHAFWKEFESERARLMERLKQLTQEAANNPELEEELTAFLTFYGNEHELADKLQKRMLQQKKDEEVRIKMEERSLTLKQLDEEEQAAVARKDYGAAGRAQSQKKTALAHWAEEDATA